MFFLPGTLSHDDFLTQKDGLERPFGCKSMFFSWKFWTNTQSSKVYLYFIAGNTCSKPLLLVSTLFQQLQNTFHFAWYLYMFQHLFSLLFSTCSKSNQCLSWIYLDTVSRFNQTCLTYIYLDVFCVNEHWIFLPFRNLLRITSTRAGFPHKESSTVYSPPPQTTLVTACGTPLYHQTSLGSKAIAIVSRYGMFTYIWLIFMVNIPYVDPMGYQLYSMSTRMNTDE